MPFWEIWDEHAVPQGMGLPVSPKSFPETSSWENLMRLPLITLVKCWSAVRWHVQVPDTNNSSTTQYREFLSVSCQLPGTSSHSYATWRDHSPRPQQLCCSLRTRSFIMPGLPLFAIHFKPCFLQHQRTLTYEAINLKPWKAVLFILKMHLFFLAKIM